MLFDCFESQKNKVNTDNDVIIRNQCDIFKKEASEIYAKHYHMILC